MVINRQEQSTDIFIAPTGNSKNTKGTDLMERVKCNRFLSIKLLSSNK